MSILLNQRETKSRIGHERLLNFDGVNQHLKIDNVGDFSADFAFSFIYKKNSLSINEGMIDLRIDNNAFISIRSGASGLVCPVGVFFKSTANPSVDLLSQPVPPSGVANQDDANLFATVVVNFKQTSNTVEVYRNTRLLYSVTDPNLTGFDISGLPMIIAGLVPNTPINFIDGEISHVATYTRALTGDEVLTLHNNGGLLPISTHEDVRNHWPLTQKYYYKADADFVANNPEFAINDLVAFDVVEQYNYSKVTPLGAIHARLVNFTDLEAGAVEPATQDSIIDVFSKQVSVNWGLKFDGTTQQAFQNPLNSNIVFSNNSWSIGFELISRGATSKNIIDTLDTSGDPWIRVEGSEGEISIVIAASLAESSAIVATIPTQLEGKRIRVVLHFPDENRVNWRVYINGLQASIVNSGGDTLTGNAPPTWFFKRLYLAIRANLDGGSRAEHTIQRVVFFDDTLSLNELNEFSLNGKVNNSKLIEDINPEKRTDNVINTLLGNVITLQNFNLLDFNGYYLEKDTEYPQIRQALRMLNTQQILFPSNIGDQIGQGKASLILTLKFDSNINNSGVRNIFRFVGSTTMYFFAISDGRVRGQNDQAFEWAEALQTPTYFEELHLNGEPGLTSGNTNVFSRNGFFQENVTSLTAQDFTGQPIQLRGVDNGLNFARLDIFDRHLSKKEVALSAANMFYSNKIVDETLIASYRFNEEDFFEDGQVKIRDRSGNGYDGIITGFSGATSADQLIDLLSNVQLIDSLR